VAEHLGDRVKLLHDQRVRVVSGRRLSLRAIRNEPEVHSSVAEACEQIEAALTALVVPAGIAPADR